MSNETFRPFIIEGRATIKEPKSLGGLPQFEELTVIVTPSHPLAEKMVHDMVTLGAGSYRVSSITAIGGTREYRLRELSMFDADARLTILSGRGPMEENNGTMP